MPTLVSTGQLTITDVTDGLNVRLSNQAHLLPASSDGTVSSFAGCSTTVTVMLGAVNDTANWTITATPSGVTGTLTGATYTVTGITGDTGTVELVASRTGYSSLSSTFSIAKARSGAPGISALLSNESHTFSAATDGTVASYTGSGTEIRVYEGATQLAYDAVGTANGTWKVVAAGSSITPGTVTDSGSHATVGQHGAMLTTSDTASVTYTITGKTSTGTAFSLTKVQTFAKAKSGSNGAAGAAGAAGSPGPAVVLVSDRPATFTSTDTVLDAGQADIVLTANTQGLTSPTFAWTFSGLQTAPTSSTTASQTITAAQFGTSKSAIVTVTVNGSIVDKLTIVRLERSTAEAGATVGATIGTNLSGQITATNASTFIANAAISSAQIADATITSAKIADAAITSAKIADASIGAAKIADAAITSAKIGTAEIKTLNLAGNAVSVSNYASGNNNASTNLSIPSGVTASVFALLTKSVGSETSGGTPPGSLTLTIHGTNFSTSIWPVSRQTEFSGTLNAYDQGAVSGQVSVTGPATVTVSGSFNSSLANPVSLFAFARWK